MKPIVLAVDDEPDILFLLQNALQDEGYEVLTATTAAEFRTLYSNNDISIYLVDVALPDGNGFRLVRELRRVTKRGILMLTGRASETDHVVGLEIGADDYIVKPFRIRELVARVNAVYRRTVVFDAGSLPEVARADNPPTTVDFEFDKYQLSINARQLWHKENGEIELTTAEFDLLLALLRRRGQVFGREQLMTAMKGREWESYDRAIDGLVSRLRRKLHIAGGRVNFIRTVHGVGYSFVA